MFAFAASSLNAGIVFHVEEYMHRQELVSFCLTVGTRPGLCSPSKALIATPTSVAVSCIAL